MLVPLMLGQDACCDEVMNKGADGLGSWHPKLGGPCRSQAAAASGEERARRFGDALIVEDVTVYDERLSNLALLAQSVTTKVVQAARRQTDALSQDASSASQR
jgi:hypothetical protein